MNFYNDSTRKHYKEMLFKDSLQSLHSWANLSHKLGETPSSSPNKQQLQLYKQNHPERWYWKERTLQNRSVCITLEQKLRASSSCRLLDCQHSQRMQVIPPTCSAQSSSRSTQIAVSLLLQLGQSYSKLTVPHTTFTWKIEGKKIFSKLEFWILESSQSGNAGLPDTRQTSSLPLKAKPVMQFKIKQQFALS